MIAVGAGEAMGASQAMQAARRRRVRPNRREVLRRLAKELPLLREKYGVESLALYGSVARGEASASSDVDLVVKLSKPLGLEFVELAEHLERVLGRKVDLATEATLARCLEDPRYRPAAIGIQRSLQHVEAEA
jgi:predicted nucleotidyltransferase